jgi:glycosyltransferase 2 family protein
MKGVRDEAAAPAAPPTSDSGAGEARTAARSGGLSGALPLLIRLAVSAALLVFLFSKVPLADVLALFGRARGDIVLLSAVLFALSLVGSAYQWWLFLRAQRIAIPFRRAMNFYLVGLFLNNFLPANVGGDVMKVIDVGRSGGTKVGALTATLLDRAMGLFVLVLAGTLAAVMLGDALPFPELRVPLVLSCAALVILFAAVLSRRVARVVEPVLRHVPGARLRRLAERLIAHVRMLHDDRRIFLVAFAVSVATQILRIAVHYLAAIALGVHVAPILFALLVPVIAVAITLPISIGGFGVREGLGVVLFGRVGVGSTEALAFELLSHLVAVLVSVWGGVLFILRARPPR